MRFLPRSFLIIATAALLCGCAPNHLLIDRAELEGVEQRLASLEERLAALDARNREDNDGLSLQHWIAISTLMQTMLAEFERLRERTAAVPAPATAAAGERPRGEAAPARSVSSATARIDGKHLVGAVEKVLLTPPGLLLEARIDTGAESASLDARDIREFERDGHTWVRFGVVDRANNEVHEIERRVIRFVRIFQSSAEGYERRPVVELRVTIGEVSQTAEFTLSDREHLSFPVLIGRNVIKDVMVVDVGRSHIAPPRPPAADRPNSR